MRSIEYIKILTKTHEHIRLMNPDEISLQNQTDLLRLITSQIEALSADELKAIETIHEASWLSHLLLSLKQQNGEF